MSNGDARVVSDAGSAKNHYDRRCALTREELYALVWQTPLSRLARTFGLSDVGLRKICVKHNIKDVFIWAYERSAARYIAVRQSLGEPDPFRLQHRAALREIIGEIIRRRMDRKAASAHIASWVQ